MGDVVRVAKDRESRCHGFERGHVNCLRSTERAPNRVGYGEMSSMWHVFQACGWSSYLCLLAALLAVLLGSIGIVVALTRTRAAVWLAWTACLVALSPAAAGAFGVMAGRSKTDQVIVGDFIDPEQRERIRTEGYQEAGGCAVVGGTLTLPPLLLAGVALVLAYSLRRKDVARQTHREAS